MTERSAARGTDCPSIDAVAGAPGALTVRVRGTVDLRTVRRLRDVLERLLGPAERPVRSLVIDLSAVERCDFRALVVLDDARSRLHASRSRFAVRGLGPDVLIGFGDAGLSELFAAYRASRDTARTSWPTGSDGGEPPGNFNGEDARLVRSCLDLATVRRTPAGAVDVAAVSRGLVGLCVSRFGGGAAVVLVGGSGRWTVGAASTEGARLLVVAGLAAREGPVAECLHHGGPVSVPDLHEQAQRWPQFLRVAAVRGVSAVRALPMRGPSRSAADGPIGVLALFSSIAGPMQAPDLDVAQTFADLAVLGLGPGGAPRGTARQDDIAPTVSEPRVVVEQAIGVLRQVVGIGATEARALLRTSARSRDLPLVEMSRAIVTGAVDPARFVGRPSAPSSPSSIDALDRGRD